MEQEETMEQEQEEFPYNSPFTSGYYALGHYACEQLRDFGKAPYNGDNGDYGNRAHIDEFMVHRIPKWSEEADSSILSPASKEHPPT